MRKNIAILADDDSVLVRAISDDLRQFFKEKDIEFEACTSTEEISNFIIRNKEKEVVMAIVDLWMNEKKTNISNRRAGIKIIQLLRAKWPNSYIIVYSGHIDQAVNIDLDKFKNLGIFEKPVLTSTLKFHMNNALNGMGL